MARSDRRKKTVPSPARAPTHAPPRAPAARQPAPPAQPPQRAPPVERKISKMTKSLVRLRRLVVSAVGLILYSVHGRSSSVVFEFPKHLGALNSGCLDAVASGLCLFSLRG